MKNRMIKVWGIVLTLAILAGLLVAAVPVSAANLAWTPNAIPSVNNNFLLADPVDSWVFAASADGSTILAYDGTNDAFYKSVDGGVTFVSEDVGTGLGTGITMMAIADDKTTAVATDGTDLYGSVNGGTSWVAMDLPSSFVGPITCIDAATGPSFLIGGDGNFARFGSSSQLGGNWSVFTDWYNDTLEGAAVIGIAFSPTYASDKQIIVVTNDATNTYVGISNDGLPVGRIYADLQIASSAAASAVIAFPSDFVVAPGANGNFLVGLDDTGLWRVNVNGFAVAPVEVAASNNIYNAYGVTSLAFNGNWAAGTAYFVNDAATPALMRITGAGASSVSAVNTSVTGIPMGVSAAEGKVAVLSGGTGGAFNVSFDSGASFVQTNLIQSACLIDKITFADPNTIFIIADGNSVYKTTDAGVSWQRIQYQQGLDTFTNAYVSPTYATDNAVYFSTGSPLAWKSTDGGKTLVPFSVADAINDLVIVDANTYFYATDAGVYKSANPFSPLTGINGAYSLYYVDAANIYAGTINGKVFKSTDGATFAEVGKTSAFAAPYDGNVVVAATADGTVYAASDVAGAGVKKFGPTGWTAVGDLGTTATVADLAVNADGTVYAVDTASDIVYRNADGATFEDMAFGAANSPAAATVFGNTIYVNGIGYMANFTDTLSAPPAFTSPAEGATLLDVSIATLSWGAVTGATEYEWNISTTADMDSGFMIGNTTRTTSVFLPNEGMTLVNGQTYYVTVQVTAPFNSKVSAVTEFQTKLNSLPTTLNINAPAAGANVTSKTPTFSWSAVANAVSYEFKLSDKPDFSTTVDSTTDLNGTVYTTGVTLEEGKTYYWQVRAVNGDISSDWAQSTFNVAAAGGETGGPAITVNPPAVTVQPPDVIVTVEPADNVSNSTPPWVWVIIAIGAVLVIAVIVLIARTRRV